jgi:hypothetical protein
MIEMEKEQPIIETLREHFEITVDYYREYIPDLIEAKRPIEAIHLATTYDNLIRGIHSALTKVYAMFLARMDLILKYSPDAETILKRKGLLGFFSKGLHETSGMFPNGDLPEGVTEEGLLKKATKALGGAFRKDLIISDSPLDSLIFVEIQYMLYVLEDLVEDDSVLADTIANEVSEVPARLIPKSVKHEVWNRDGGRCVECGSKERLEYDHIIPVSKGGSNTARNVQLLCEQCNRLKAARIA